MREEVKVLISARTDRVGSKTETEISFDKEDWDAMTEKERNDACFDTVMGDLVDWNYEVME